MLQVFGIRHHGPGSSKSLLKALHNFEPDILLIEGPPDANDLIGHVQNLGLIPPVALLVYNPKNLKQAAYFPFASFSPEWQAMRYGLEHDIPVEFMDLPMSLQFSLNEQTTLNLFEENLPSDEDEEDVPEEDLAAIEREIAAKKKKQEKAKALRLDPLSYIAQLAGYSDSERWWEVTFEQHKGDGDIFPAVTELMSALRSDTEAEENTRGLQREAYMRTCIRAAQKKGFEKIAIVCGAWHAPTLQDIDQYKASADKASLKGIKKIKTKATWVPWTYDRLSVQSGYGAGILSPAWYQLLFTDQADAVVLWMTKVARLFREEGIDASSAHVIEAVRLADTLATIRNLPIAGIDELFEAAISIFCSGYESKMDIVQRKQVIGDVMGKVPADIPMIPLQQDLEKQIKSARLSKEYATTELIEEKKLDLRVASNLTASQLLHRLNLLGLPWGKQLADSKKRKGSFSESWAMQWKPDFAIQIIEAGMWGNTVEVAATNFVKTSMKKISTLPALTKMVQQTLNAGLDDAIEDLVEQLQNLSAITKDVLHLMEALPSLVNTIRYGSTRQLNIGALEQVVDQIIPRICIGLPNACIAIDEAATERLFKHILQVNRAINQLNIKEHNLQWHKTLEQIVQSFQINGILSGACTRLLFDKSIFDEKETATQMLYALSKGNDTTKAAYWLEGFLHGSGLLLIHNPALWNILDRWVDELPFAAMKELLPLLRRTFSNFSTPEKEKMLLLAKQGQRDETHNQERLIEIDAAQKVLPTLKLLLGID